MPFLVRRDEWEALHLCGPAPLKREILIARNRFVGSKRSRDARRHGIIAAKLQGIKIEGLHLKSVARTELVSATFAAERFFRFAQQQRHNQ
jgi:hypothetical protein